MYDIDGTQQEVFDRVVLHFVDQKRPAMNHLGSCKYRFNGLKCAAGVLIPDEKYAPVLEGHDFCQLIDTFWDDKACSMADPLFTCNPSLIALITGLQMAHDHSRAWHIELAAKELLVNELRNVAKQFHLDPSKIDLITEWTA